MVSSIFLKEGDKFPIIKVNVFSVNDDCSSLVNFDYLKAATLLYPADKEDITFPKVVNDKFIFFSYFNC